MKKFPLFTQFDAKDCGPTCLRMISKYYGRNFSLQYLRKESFITREGVSLLGISDAAERIGFRTQGILISFEQLVKEVQYPCILHWNKNHFVVCYNVRSKRHLLKSTLEKDYEFSIADPIGHLFTFSKDDFLKKWISTKTGNVERGVALILTPTPQFYNQESEKIQSKINLMYFCRYLEPHKSQLIQLILGMGMTGLIQLCFPFLTQSMIDKGIGTQNMSLISLILIAQLMLFATQLGIDYIRSWIVLHMSTRISISLISDFLIKLMKLPLSFFDSRMVGDIMQRIGDHGRIQSFLTGSTLSVAFSIVSFIIFGLILAYYNLLILGVFLFGNTLYALWVLAFMRYRKALDHQRFSQESLDQSNLVQLITGMQEIKLCNCEKQKRWQWERIQVNKFKIRIKGLALGQYQQTGSVFFSQATNLTTTYIAARSVIEGHMTLGMMMSLSYIIGQLSSPIGQFIGFAQSLQDARISLERLGEIHNKEDEENLNEIRLSELPESRSIHIKNLWFSYDGADRDHVLKGINLVIPENKTTAIVGSSGCGKTTLIKLLLGFYTPNKGCIYVQDTPLKDINPHIWRQKIGIVMQEGFIFSDSIANNIAVGVEDVDKIQLLKAVEIANIREYIDSLPMGYNTFIGMEGKGVSQGQKQRLLIARAIYKDPEYLFFDEATNALDATNEKNIMGNLNKFKKNKTVVIVAHRLSTVQHADNIIVMNRGEIIEQGTHQELVIKGNTYYQLVRHQLELEQLH